MLTRQDAQLNALGDATRRAILERLLLGPSSVGKLAEEFPVSRPAISQHLKVLKGAGLVSDLVSGTLGANRGHVVALVLRGAFGLIVLGLLLGLPLTLAAGRFLGHQLYGMNPYDPVVTSVAVLALGLSALLASLIPAFRASLISPLEALRAE